MIISVTRPALHVSLVSSKQNKRVLNGSLTIPKTLWSKLAPKKAIHVLLYIHNQELLLL